MSPVLVDQHAGRPNGALCGPQPPTRPETGRSRVVVYNGAPPRPRSWPYGALRGLAGPQPRRLWALVRRQAGRGGLRKSPPPRPLHGVVCGGYPRRRSPTASGTRVAHGPQGRDAD